MKFKKLKLDNFRYLLISSSICAFMSGIFGPFYVLYVQNLSGGIENFGIAFGLITLSSSFTSYFVGRYSDKIGRKPFLICSSFVSAALLISYVFIKTVPQLFIIQVLSGIGDSVWVISEKTFLSDITKKKSRGRIMGKYDAILGTLRGTTMLFGGFLVGIMGFEIIFYLMAAAIVVSAIPLFFIKEKR